MLNPAGGALEKVIASSQAETAKTTVEKKGNALLIMLLGNVAPPPVPGGVEGSIDGCGVEIK